VKKNKFAYYFLLPFFLVMGIFFTYPFFLSIYLSFFQTNGPLTKIFVGFENFTYVFSDPLFYKALVNTSLYTLGTLLLQVPLALLLAMALNKRLGRMRNAFRLIYFTPNLVGHIFVGIMFSIIFLPRFGLFNRFLYAITGWGLEIEWLRTPQFIVPILILVAMWIYTGFNMVYFLAALQNVDDQLVEAANLDGAGKWGVFRHAVLPAIFPVLIFVVVMSTIGSFQLFELPYALLQAKQGIGGTYGPENAGITLVAYLYSYAFDIGDLGLASAIGWIITLIIVFLGMMQLVLMRRSQDRG